MFFNLQYSEIDIESLVEDCFAEEMMKEVEPISICPTPLMGKYTRLCGGADEGGGAILHLSHSPHG